MKRLLMAACLPALLVCHTAPPAPPQSLLQALSSAQTAVATNGDIPTTCAALSQELSAFSQIARPVMARSDLRNLSMEVAVYGATSDASTSQPSSVARWADLKTRIDRVLAGQKPMEGPRYQIDAPESVRSGMAKVDAALARADADSAARAMYELTGPLMEWAGRLPGMRAATVMEIVEHDLSRLSYVQPGTQSVESLSAQWQQIRKRLDPRAK